MLLRQSGDVGRSIPSPADWVAQCGGETVQPSYAGLFSLSVEHSLRILVVLFHGTSQSRAEYYL